MGRNASNHNLQQAKKAKSDEFYTQYCDIERELQYYEKQFQGKIVYCNCDDPRNSNFVRYFIDNFDKLGLKKLIASCYQESTVDLFHPIIRKGFYCEYLGDGKPVELVSLRDNGDFRSSECVNLLKSADVVVTNPPFSLFREFMAQIVKYGKEFLIIGNINAITYKEIFELIQQDKIWLGVNLGRGISGFIVPEDYELYGTETRVDELGNRIVSTNNCLWLTNLDLSKRRMDIPLTELYVGNEQKYPKYDNCDGINVDKTLNIPKDYFGLMGVPITFLHKYNPNQFEIIRFRKGDDGKDLSIRGKCPYFRILVRQRRKSI